MQLSSLTSNICQLQVLSVEVLSICLDFQEIKTRNLLMEHLYFEGMKSFSFICLIFMVARAHISFVGKTIVILFGSAKVVR